MFFSACFAFFADNILYLWYFFVRVVNFRLVLLGVEWLFVLLVKEFDLYHLLKLQSRFLFVYNVQKKKTAKILDWYSTIPFFYSPNFLNCSVNITLQVPEKWTNWPISVQSSMEIDWIVFQSSFFSPIWKKKLFYVLVQVHNCSQFSNLVLNHWHVIKEP